MDKSTVQILLATYNGAEYLQEQLDSIYAQTYTEWELLIKDDGSEDTTLEIIKNNLTQRESHALCLNRRLAPHRLILISWLLENELFDKTYSNETIQLSDDFLQFEHTDGLNYINVEIKRFDDISHWFGLEMKNLQFNLTEGVGTGILFPKTNSTLLGKERHDDFHLSGWGISAGAGLNITFLKHFFIQADYKIGYIDMPSIRTTLSPSDTASQNFFFFENTFLFGGRFKLF